MRLPLSAKTLIRLHRKIFMLRTPRKPQHTAYSLSLAPDGKSPLVHLRVEKTRTPILGITLAVAAVLAAMIAWGRE